MNIVSALRISVAQQGPKWVSNGQFEINVVGGDGVRGLDNRGCGRVDELIPVYGITVIVFDEWCKEFLGGKFRVAVVVVCGEAVHGGADSGVGEVEVPTAGGRVVCAGGEGYEFALGFGGEIGDGDVVECGAVCGVCEGCEGVGVVGEFGVDKRVEPGECGFDEVIVEGQ